MERRLQTQVFKLGLAKSMHHARVLIRQRHIRCAPGTRALRRWRTGTPRAAPADSLRASVSLRRNSVGKQIVNVPSFMVRVDSQKHIDFALNSPFGGGRAGRVKRRNVKARGVRREAACISIAIVAAAQVSDARTPALAPAERVQEGGGRRRRRGGGGVSASAAAGPRLRRAQRGDV